MRPGHVAEGHKRSRGWHVPDPPISLWFKRRAPSSFPVQSGQWGRAVLARAAEIPRWLKSNCRFLKSRLSALAPDAVHVAIKVMRVWRENPEIPVANFRAIQVWGRGRYAYIRIRRVAVRRRRRRG